jgi:hypothetical protein
MTHVALFTGDLGLDLTRSIISLLLRAESALIRAFHHTPTHNPR